MNDEARAALATLNEALAEADALASTFLDLAEAAGDAAPKWPFAVLQLVGRITAASEALEEALRRPASGSPAPVRRVR